MNYQKILNHLDAMPVKKLKADEYWHDQNQEIGCGCIIGELAPSSRTYKQLPVIQLFEDSPAVRFELGIYGLYSSAAVELQRVNDLEYDSDEIRHQAVREYVERRRAGDDHRTAKLHIRYKFPFTLLLTSPE